MARGSGEGGMARGSGEGDGKARSPHAPDLYQRWYHTVPVRYIMPMFVSPTWLTSPMVMVPVRRLYGITSFSKSMSSW